MSYSTGNLRNPKTSPNNKFCLKTPQNSKQLLNKSYKSSKSKRVGLSQVSLSSSSPDNPKSNTENATVNFHRKRKRATAAGGANSLVKRSRMQPDVGRAGRHELVNIALDLAYNSDKMYDRMVRFLRKYFENVKFAEVVVESRLVAALLDFVAAEAEGRVCEFHASLQLLTTPLASEYYDKNTISAFGLAPLFTPEIFNSILTRLRLTDYMVQRQPVFCDIFRTMYYLLQPDSVAGVFFDIDGEVFDTVVTVILKICNDDKVQSSEHRRFLRTLEMGGMALIEMVRNLHIEDGLSVAADVVPKLVQLVRKALTLRMSSVVVQIMCQLLLDFVKRFHHDMGVTTALVDAHVCGALIKWISPRRVVSEAPAVLASIVQVVRTVLELSEEHEEKYVLSDAPRLAGVLLLLLKQKQAVGERSEQLFHEIGRCLLVYSQCKNVFTDQSSQLISVEDVSALFDCLFQAPVDSKLRLALTWTAVNVLSRPGFFDEKSCKERLTGIATAVCEFMREADRQCGLSEVVEGDELEISKGSVIRLLQLLKTCGLSDSELFRDAVNNSRYKTTDEKSAGFVKSCCKMFSLVTMPWIS